MKKIWWSLIVIWCGFIFFQSNQPAHISSAESGIFVDLMDGMLTPFIGRGDREIYSFIIRKTAHFTEYFILGLLLFKGFFSEGKLKKAFVVSFFAGLLYAVSDEIHQYFIPGREMRAFDVFIDSLGVIAGLGLSLVFNNKKPFHHDK